MELTSAPVISQMPEARNYKTGWLLKVRGKGKIESQIGKTAGSIVLGHLFSHQPGSSFFSILL